MFSTPVSLFVSDIVNKLGNIYMSHGYVECYIGLGLCPTDRESASLIS